MGNKVTCVYLSLSHSSHFGKLNGRGKRQWSGQGVISNNHNLYHDNILVQFVLCSTVESNKKQEPIKSCVLKPGFFWCQSFQKAADISYHVFIAEISPTKPTTLPNSPQPFALENDMFETAVVVVRNLVQCLCLWCLLNLVILSTSLPRPSWEHESKLKLS